ncbi:MAG: bifunctional precorrin-2 dehydrogenase/sirohydrochlorin ferrochelatase [Dehalococcoidia bacterium]
MGYYPIFVEMRGRRVLLVGGGHVALEKIGKLVEAEADVTLVAPALIPEVRAFIDVGRAHLLERDFAPGDTAGAEMVFVATDDGSINRRVADEARAAGIWVNAADDVANCDFILPGLAQRGRIAIATSTGGASPALARWLRERMEDFLSDGVVALADVLADLRVRARARDRECAAGCDRTQPPPPLLCKTCPNRIPADRWQGAIDDEVLAMLRAGDREGASARIAAAIGLDQPLLARA